MAELERRGRHVPKVASARDATGEQVTSGDVLRVIGPGVITGGADNDPAGIGTYSIVGATAGFAENWLLFRSAPMLVVVQHVSANVADATQTDLPVLPRPLDGDRVDPP